MTNYHKKKQLNNEGLTLVELIVTFALLGLFMVAATRVISYTVGIYYEASGNSYGLQVANMISNKIVGQLEGARGASNPEVKSDGSGIDSISFIDSTGSNITISATPQKNSDGTTQGMYMNIHYDEVSEGTIKYAAVDWRFDAKTYMGYVVRELRFEDPGADYPENVVKMTLVLYSNRYGEYKTTSYIKCIGVEKIVF